LSAMTTAETAWRLMKVRALPLVHKITGSQRH